MANNYGISEIEGSPSQKDIDGYLNWCDNNPTDFAADIQQFNNDTKKKIKEKLEQLKKDAQALLDDTIKPPIEDLKKRMTPIKPLIEPPSSLDDCLTFCTDVANYFKDPYMKLVELIAWWTKYIAACSSATAKMIAKCESQMAELVTDPTGEKKDSTEPRSA